MSSLVAGEQEAPAAAGPKSFVRREKLRAMEGPAQKMWREDKVFECEAEFDGENATPKYLVTFPYPYMNGKLHLGHAYSMSKAEFMVRYQRMLGKNALFPFGFHCTGMPIQAAANKLKAEIAQFGCPPNFESDEAELAAKAEAEAKADAAAAAEVSVEKKGKGKKTKLVQKTGGATARQWNIMKMMVPEEEIAGFTDPLKWLEYFPPHGKADLVAFGTAVDWRRSFITTSVNPYYDSFIRWQFNTLKANGKVRFGKRANVFSGLDGQVCADHDRASGEGVGPQEYTIIKLKVLELNAKLAPLEGKNVFLAPATLRPETMYGQTNCFVLPEGVYGAYAMKGGDIFIMSARAAKGFAYQDETAEWGKVDCLLDGITGNDLIGLPLKAPNAKYDVVYTLPLLTISMGKGTGVVTSVPSDAPDDYAALQELKDKPVFRAKFNLTDEMVMPFEVVPIIDIPGYGNKSAEFMCQKLKIKGCNDAVKLKQAKEEVYMKGFYEGVMEVGECKGEKVCDAKPIIRQAMIASGDAVIYWEPESLVMSRSGDECIVALTDQWYLPYGEETWAEQVREHVNSKNFNCYTQASLDKFNFTLGWLKEWACTRKFGLGTQLPWDESWVIESLSDSTIYMAYYTIAHLLHGENNLTGTTSSSPCGMQAESFNDEVWDYIFLRGAMPSGNGIDATMLERMRTEFEYWYPMDMRVSAKDLIPNHLTMALYNHSSIWNDRPELWPRSYFTNGHVQVDAEKMSKSKGNFLMLSECIERFGADPTRLAIANAGDSLDDANFEMGTANLAILTLTTEEEFFRSITAEDADLRTGSPEEFFMDKAFASEMARIIQSTGDAFSAMMWRDGIQCGMFELQIARDIYRDWAKRTGHKMHKNLARKFVEVQVLLLAPITPHFCEHVWSNILGNKGAIAQAAWPKVGEMDLWTNRAYKFLMQCIKTFRGLQGKLSTDYIKAKVVVEEKYVDWKEEVLLYLQSVIVDGQIPKDFMKGLKGITSARKMGKKESQGVMQFASFLKEQYLTLGAQALETTLPFDQAEILKENKAFMTSSLGLQDIEIFITTDADCPKPEGKVKKAPDPGHPEIYFYKS